MIVKHCIPYAPVHYRSTGDTLEPCPTVHTDGPILPHLFSPVEESLFLHLGFEGLYQHLSQLLYLGEFAQVVDTDIFAPVHCPHLYPHLGPQYGAVILVW